MTPIDILNYIEREDMSEVFTDLHIINDTVVGFYKTQHIKYENMKGEETSYLFPTTFRNVNGLIHTTMVVGSVERNFKIPRIHQFDDNYGTKLQTFGIQSHLYKLLSITQYIQLNNCDYYDECEGFNIKMLMDSIHQLDRIGFPFMRITNNNLLDS
jgi:hypothetical protein